MVVRKLQGDPGGVAAFNGGKYPHPELRREGWEPLPDNAGDATLLSRSGGDLMQGHSRRSLGSYPPKTPNSPKGFSKAFLRAECTPVVWMDFSRSRIFSGLSGYIRKSHGQHQLPFNKLHHLMSAGSTMVPKEVAGLFSHPAACNPPDPVALSLLPLG